MGLENVIKGIEEEARGSADSILGSAREQAASIISEARVRTAAEMASMEQDLRRELLDERNIKVSDAKRKARQALLCAKEELIWDTLCEVRKGLGGLRGETLERTLSSLLGTARDSMGGDAELYAVREIDAKILRSKGMEISGVIEAMSEPPEKVRRYTGRDLIGGFIAFSREGKRVMDLTFQGLIDRDMDRIRERISEVLFSD